MLKKFILTVLIIIYTFSIFSQDTWSLERCINYALENNIQIKQQELNTKYHSNNYNQSKTGVLPNLNFTASRTYSYGKALDYLDYNYKDKTQRNDFRLSSSVTLFQGLQNYNTISKNNYDMQASLQDLQQIKNNVSLTIASAFLNILFNEELVTVSQEQLEITKQQVERAEKLLEAGSIAKGRLLEIQAQAASEELRLINAQNQLDISYLTIVQLLELDSISNFKINIPENIEVSFRNIDILSIGSIYTEAESSLPQIKGAELRLKGSEKQLLIAKGGVSPSLSITASYGSMYSIPAERIVYGDDGYPLVDANGDVLKENYLKNDQFNDFLSTSLSFNLRVPIFNGLMVKNNVDNAKIGILNSRLDLENQKNILLKDIQQAYADAIAAYKKYLASDKALVAMEESFRYTQEKYEVGLVNTVDYNAAKNQLAQTKSDLLQAKYEYIFKTKILDFYRGIPIKI